MIRTPAPSDRYAPKCAAGESLSRHPRSKDIEEQGLSPRPCLSLGQLIKVHLIPISLEYASFLLIEPKIQETGHLNHLATTHIYRETPSKDA